MGDDSAAGSGWAKNKWAMVAYKGGVCIACGRPATWAKMSEFHFDHKVQLNSTDAHSQRWGGAPRNWTCFSEKWKVWAETVNLLCKECHDKRHRKNGQQLSLLAFEEIQTRLDEFANNEMHRYGNGRSTWSIPGDGG